MDDKRFDIPGLISVGPGEGGLARIRMTSGAANAEVYLLGATVTRYDVGDRQVLFCSRTSKFAPGKAIRGGVPIIFPWFGPHPTDASLPQHGFARTSEWAIIETRRGTNGEAIAVLELAASNDTIPVWPYEFRLRYTVTVGDRLTMALEVLNLSDSAFQFTEALHTYLTVTDVRKAEITGLEGVEFADKVDGMARKRLADEPLVLSGETDRVFVNTVGPCTLHDPAGPVTVVEKAGSQSTVVWNPWEKADSMADLGGGQWPGFVCIETVNALDNTVSLAAGSMHTMTAVIVPKGAL